MEIKKITDEMRRALRAPLPAEAVKPNPSKSYLSTIKPIFVTERLNDVFGIGTWQIRTELVAPITAEAKTKGNRSYTDFTSLMKTIFTIPEYGVYYECIAGSSNEDEGDAAKGGTTDGITKICSWMEIGINVFKGLGNVADKEPNKAPVTPPVQAQPSTAPKPGTTPEPAKLATNKQREELIRLLNNPVITSAEKAKGLTKVAEYTEDIAVKVITHLKKVIADREEENAKKTGAQEVAPNSFQE